MKLSWGTVEGERLAFALWSSGFGFLLPQGEGQDEGMRLV